MAERPPRPARRARGARTSAASRSTSCIATCRRRTSSSASTASRACSTSASRRRPGAHTRRRDGAAQGQARVHGARAAARKRVTRQTDVFAAGGRALGDAHGPAALRGGSRRRDRDEGSVPRDPSAERSTCPRSRRRSTRSSSARSTAIRRDASRRRARWPSRSSRCAGRGGLGGRRVGRRARGGRDRGARPARRGDRERSHGPPPGARRAATAGRRDRVAPARAARGDLRSADRVDEGGHAGRAASRLRGGHGRHRGCGARRRRPRKARSRTIDGAAAAGVRHGAAASSGRRATSCGLDRHDRAVGRGERRDHRDGTRARDGAARAARAELEGACTGKGRVRSSLRASARRQAHAEARMPVR